MYVYVVTFKSTSFYFLFNDPAPAEIYTLSLHDALPISAAVRDVDQLLRIGPRRERGVENAVDRVPPRRSEEHTSELQSLRHLVCRLLLEKKKSIQKHLPNRCFNYTLNRMAACSWYGTIP